MGQEGGPAIPTERQAACAIARAPAVRQRTGDQPSTGGDGGPDDEPDEDEPVDPVDDELPVPDEDDPVDPVEEPVPPVRVGGAGGESLDEELELPVVLLEASSSLTTGDEIVDVVTVSAPTSEPVES